ncbi:MAG: ferritin [Chloroflexi bacterium]|nr:ferritin [Chloroflexota bacterium]
MNVHLNAELYSSYLYLSMAAHFEAANLPGMAGWMRIQSQEEYGHGMKFFEFINDRGGEVSLLAIAQPPTAFASVLDVFEQTLAHEREVTAKIHRLYEQALSARDYACQVFLQWFVTEQVEEEKTASQILETVRSVGDNKLGLIMLDRQLAARRSE